MSYLRFQKSSTSVKDPGKALGVGGYIDIGLIDTMYDLFVNFIGAIVFSFFGYFYVVNRGKGNFVNRFIPRLKDRDHH